MRRCAGVFVSRWVVAARGGMMNSLRGSVPHTPIWANGILPNSSVPMDLV